MVTLDDDDLGVSYRQSGCADSGVRSPDNFFSASGFLAADPVTATSPAVWSCVTARSAPVVLFPTEWAPHGIVKVTLEQSSLQCKVIRSAGVRTATATPRFAARVEYWNGSSYVLAGRVTQASTVDPLAAVLFLDPSVGHGFTLTDFIQSWKASTGGDVEVTGAGSAVRAKIPGVVSIDSQPTRALDDDSVVSVTVGTFTCDAKDVR